MIMIIILILSGLYFDDDFLHLKQHYVTKYARFETKYARFKYYGHTLIDRCSLP